MPHADACHLRLEREDGTPAEPPTLKSAVPNWRREDTIPLGGEKTLRVVAIRDHDADQRPVFVVEEWSPNERVT
jgi:hypothetical protein